MKIALTILISLLFMWVSFASLEQIRIDRIKACEYVNDKFELWQDIIRCATYNHLIYAFESGWWESRMCKNNYNCRWIKIPTDRQWLEWINWAVIDRANHLWFESKQDWNKVFAYYYMMYHIDRTAFNFVNRWAWRTHWNYINFLINNYDEVYNLYYNLKQ